MPSTSYKESIKTLLNAPFRIDLFMAFSELDPKEKTNPDTILDIGANIAIRYIDEMKTENRKENKPPVDSVALIKKSLFEA